MKTLLLIAALTCFFAGLASASTDLNWGGSGSIDTRPSIGGRVEIGVPEYSPPRYSPPSYDHRYENYPNQRVEIRRTHRHRRHYCRHHSHHYHYEREAPVVRIEMPRPRYEEPRFEAPREDVEIEIESDLAAARELVGSIFGMNISARWDLENL